jgi:hypothetical protein
MFAQYFLEYYVYGQILLVAYVFKCNYIPCYAGVEGDTVKPVRRGHIKCAVWQVCHMCPREISMFKNKLWTVKKTSHLDVQNKSNLINYWVCVFCENMHHWKMCLFLALFYKVQITIVLISDVKVGLGDQMLNRICDQFQKSKMAVDWLQFFSVSRIVISRDQIHLLLYMYMLQILHLFWIQMFLVHYRYIYLDPALVELITEKTPQPSV